MEVNLQPETESRLRELAEGAGRIPSRLIEDAVAAYLGRGSPASEEQGCQYDGLKAEGSSRLWDVHRSEYEALTTRITYYVTLQYSTWAIAAVLFGYLAPLGLRGSDHRSFEWTGLLCVLSVSWAALHINYEMLVIVRYLIEVLLPKIESDFSTDRKEALGFEGWIRGLGRWINFHRNIGPDIIFGLAAIVLGAILGQDIFARGWGHPDTLWALVCSPLAAIVCVKTCEVLRIGGLLNKLTTSNRQARVP